MEYNTLPKLLRYHYEQHPDHVALREKRRGVWKSCTWHTFYEKTRYLCLGLVSLGLQPNDKVTILGESKPEWLYAELAVQAAGGIAVGLFSDCTASEVKYYVEDSESVFIIAHDQEQVDKVLLVENELPLLKKVIYWDSKGLWNYENSLLVSFNEVLKTGKEFDESYPEIFDRNIDKGQSDDIAVICYTSGTTGKPKGAKLNYRFLVHGTMQWAGFDDWMGKRYEYLSFIPLAISIEQQLGLAGSLVAEMKINFPEKPETAQADFREIAPDVLLYAARMWEMISRTIQVKMIDSTWARRVIYRLFLPIGLKVARTKSERKKVSFFWRAMNLLAYHSVFRQLRDNLGLVNAKIAYSGGAAISPDIIQLFLAMNVEVKLVYGSTETFVLTIPVSGEIRPETSGPVVPWAQVKISDEGEILAKSKYMFSGYYNNASASQNKFKDGWYRTGDFGHIDNDRHLIVIDRMEDLKPLAGGKKFSPQYNEVRLRFSPFIKDVLVIGGETRRFVTAVVNIDMNNVGQFAERKGIPYTTYNDLSQKAEVIELVRNEITQVNRLLPDHARISKFANLYKEFDADDAELTRTRKLKRTVVEERYKDLIEALYGDEKEYIAEASVAYRDGRSGIIKTSIKLETVEE